MLAFNDFFALFSRKRRPQFVRYYQVVLYAKTGTDPKIWVSSLLLGKDFIAPFISINNPKPVRLLGQNINNILLSANFDNAEFGFPASMTFGQKFTVEIKIIYALNNQGNLAGCTDLLFFDLPDFC